MIVLHVRHSTHNFLIKCVFYILLEGITIATLPKLPCLQPQTTPVPEIMWFSLWQYLVRHHGPKPTKTLTYGLHVCSKDTKISLLFHTAGDLTGILGNRSQCGLQRTRVLHPWSKSWKQGPNPAVHPAQWTPLSCSFSPECPLSGPVLLPAQLPCHLPHHEWVFPPPFRLLMRNSRVGWRVPSPHTDTTERFTVYHLTWAFSLCEPFLPLPRQLLLPERFQAFPSSHSLIHFHTHQSLQVILPPTSKRKREATKLSFQNFRLLSLHTLIRTSAASLFPSSDQVG